MLRLGVDVGGTFTDLLLHDTDSGNAGERLVFRTAGAGGWGDPLERPPAEVLRDVRRDLVSGEAAQRDYGVVIRGDAVDEAATVDVRAAQRAQRGEPPLFDYGELPENATVA